MHLARLLGQLFGCMDIVDIWCVDGGMFPLFQMCQIICSTSGDFCSWEVVDWQVSLKQSFLYRKCSI
ncbi:unnamed protein product [Clavelina lepadiformis]|uniref:Uncharacterized protein n=1 Tax=Clavelina lepadiformis TaxID=159417 RepID=A0ABP0G853_CLALP